MIVTGLPVTNPFNLPASCSILISEAWQKASYGYVIAKAKIIICVIKYFTFCLALFAVRRRLLCNLTNRQPAGWAAFVLNINYH